MYRQHRSNRYGGVIAYVHQLLRDRIVCTETEDFDKVHICQTKSITPRGQQEIANVYAAIGGKNNNPAWTNTFNPYLILDEDVNAKGSWGKAEEILEASFNQAKLVVFNDGRPTR